jgi:hypothetical protein
MKKHVTLSFLIITVLIQIKQILLFSNLNQFPLKVKDLAAIGFNVHHCVVFVLFSLALLIFMVLPKTSLEANAINLMVSLFIFIFCLAHNSFQMALEFLPIIIATIPLIYFKLPIKSK